MNAAPPAADVVLSLRGLTKVFGSGTTLVRAVDGVDLDACRGQILLIMGPSGAGKTTLLSMAGGLLRPTSGTIVIAGQEIGAMRESQLTGMRRHTVGFIFQNFNLLGALTALENVAVALNLAGVTGHSARERAEGLLTALGMGARLHFKPTALSGGERQRVAIARALANDPPLVLADEPTANLDSRHGLAVVNLLRAIAREQGRTVVIVSHDARIQELADRVLWLEDGRLSEQ
jgi:putative ABC transport system ATP-binding protein